MSVCVLLFMPQAENGPANNNNNGKKYGFIYRVFKFVSRQTCGLRGGVAVVAKIAKIAKIAKLAMAATVSMAAIIAIAATVGANL